MHSLESISATLWAVTGAAERHDPVALAVRRMRHASAWTYGPYLIVLEGEKDADDYDKATDALKEIGAK